MVAAPSPPPPAAVVRSAVPAQPARPDQVYVVQPGDTLWSIAQHFYGNPFRWPVIYQANHDQLQDPNEIEVGQHLLIPGTTATPRPATATSRPATATPRPATNAVGTTTTIYEVNGNTAMYYIREAARGTGLPLAVVKAQNYVESDYGQDVGPSSAGAEGPWQFEPYTWGSYSSASFSAAGNWAVSTQAYIAYMTHLLQWSGGNIRMALAAYNAGQGNWQAGLGYADLILGFAGQQ